MGLRLRADKGRRSQTTHPTDSVVPAKPTQNDDLEAGRDLEAAERTAFDTLDGYAFALLPPSRE